MKQLKVGDSFLLEGSIYEVARVDALNYLIKRAGYLGCFTLLSKHHECFHRVASTTSTQVLSRHIHTMKLYQGFTDAYNYCTSCNHKEKA